MLRIIILTLIVFGSASSHAWQVSQDVTIKQLVQWQGSGNVMVILSDNKKCYSPVADKDVYSFFLAMYMANRSFTVYCYDTPETINGYGNTHKFHRLNALQD